MFDLRKNTPVTLEVLVLQRGWYVFWQGLSQKHPISAYAFCLYAQLCRYQTRVRTLHQKDYTRVYSISAPSSNLELLDTNSLQMNKKLSDAIIC